MKGFFIGRFQPFHNGHMHIIKEILGEVDELIIGIGSAQHSFTEENPFTVDERREMISKTLSREGLKNIKIFPIPDINNDDLWPGHVTNIVPEFNVIYSNNSLVKTLFKNAGKEVRTFQFFKREECSGTEIRRRIIADEEWEYLVPKTVIEIIREMGGVNRIKNLA